jgi:hypothetical protein
MSDVKLFLEHHWCLKDRIRKWLFHNPQALEWFVPTENDYRYLTYEEDEEQIALQRRLRPLPPVPVDKKKLIEAAFGNKEAYVELGVRMAEALYERANRPGFMRTILFHQDNLTVREFSEREYLLYRRIHRHFRYRSIKTTQREIVRELRARGLNV